MANYCKYHETYFIYPTFKLTAEQKAVLDKWYGYDFSYVNMNHPDEFQQFADELNAVNMPYFDIQKREGYNGGFYAVDEYHERSGTCYDEEEPKWVMFTW